MSRHIDDGFTALREYHLHHLEATHTPTDYIKTRAWTLLHQPMYHTYVHHDASGLGTWTQVLSGHKFWVAIRTPGYQHCRTRKEVYDHNSRFHLIELDPVTKEYGFRYTDDSDRFCIFAEKGDLM